MRRALAIVVVLGVAGALAIRHAGTVLVVRDPLPRHADAIVMLAGSPADRILETADLWATGLAPRVLLTRERRRAGTDALARRGVVLPEPDHVAADALVALGVPRTALLTLRARADSTAREATVVAAWACRTGARSVVVVTSPPHTRRARAIFRRALGPGVAVAVRPASAGRFAAARWWGDRHTAKLVAFEWQKLLSWWLVERWGVTACAADAVSRRPPS